MSTAQSEPKTFLETSQQPLPEKEEEYYDEEDVENSDEDYDEEDENFDDNENEPENLPVRENWEELVHVNKVQLVVKSEPQPDPIPQQQINPVTEEKPKKKMMRLNPNAEVFVPGGNSSQIEVQPFQPSFTPQGFYPQGQYPMGQNYMYPQQFPGQMRPPGQYPQFTPGGAPWNPGFSQEFPAYQGEGGSYVQPDMTFNTNVGAASFSRKLPLQAEEEDFDADGQPMDKEALKEQRKFRNKEKKKQAAQNDPSKPSKTKAPREYKRLIKKDETKPAEQQPKKKPKVEEEIDASKFTEVDEIRAPVNIVFIGHVDAGKSTICGSILLMTGRVDKNELRKLEMEAKEKKRESWYLAYIMDINEEERSKGKTVEVGKAHFQTPNKRFTILDAPGHKNYVPNMIAGASQADYAALVISAKTGEFESGFEKGGQTREHAMLAKCLGVLKLVVVINKMDEDKWSQPRYDFIKEQLSPFLANSCGFDLNKDVFWVPISGLLGHNMAELVPKEICPWYTGSCFFDIVDNLPIPERNATGNLRIPILDKMRDQGLSVFGKVESGTIYSDMTVTMMPFKKEFQITHIFNTEDQRVKYAKPGENVRLKVKNIEEEDIKRGYMISLNDNLCPVCFEFEAKLTILELPEHKPIFSQGYKAIIHMHTTMEEIEVHQVLAIVDKENKQIKSHFLKNGMVGIVRLQSLSYICLEKCEINPHLGRFTLRDEGRTIALGEVVKIKTVKGVVNTVIPVSGVEKKIEEKKVGEKKTEEPVILIEKNAEEKKEVEGN